jgi:hypothetical protein
MMPSSDSYQPPVSRLLEIGDPRERPNDDYLALGIGAEHIPELIRMAQDADLDNAGSDSAEVWAPVHARRALGRLRAEPAIQPLLGLLHRIDDEDDDWIDDLSTVFGQIGPAALAPLEAYVASDQHPLHARGIASEGLVSVGKLHPASREAAVAALTHLLENFAEPGREPALNAFLISDLVELDAVEAAPLMQRAFAARVVAEDVIGDWQAVQVELGLKDERDAPRYPQSSRPAPATQFPQPASRQPSPPVAKSKPKTPPPPKPAQSQPSQADSAPSPSGSKRHRHRHKNK